MITDQNNKGIPGVTKSRVQLATPIETANNGNLNSTANPVSERYNPIQAKVKAKPTMEDLSQPRKAITPEVDANGYNPAFGYATGMYDKESGEELFSTPNYRNSGQSVIATPYDYMRLRSMAASAPEEDLYKLLTEISEGTLSRNGLNQTTMTGEPNETNTIGTKNENLGQRRY